MIRCRTELGLEAFNAMVTKLTREICERYARQNSKEDELRIEQERVLEQMMERFRLADVNNDGEITFSGMRHLRNQHVFLAPSKIRKNVSLESSD